MATGRMLIHLISLSVSAILTPHFVPEPEKPAPIDYLNPFASLVLVSALHHHIYGVSAVSSPLVPRAQSVPSRQNTAHNSACIFPLVSLCRNIVQQAWPTIRVQDSRAGEL
jgi:hypothetical protein